eukprot:GEMP01030819.1.p1 GENE.GEMP01030819.1~~GEMP01030819.1.p1  ORF type:complete len:257 (+),score=49.93 GEMP01030819.1:533-1303(+)
MRVVRSLFHEQLDRARGLNQTLKGQPGPGKKKPHVEQQKAILRASDEFMVDEGPVLLVPLSGRPNAECCPLHNLPPCAPARNLNMIMTDKLAAQLMPFLPIGVRFEPAWTLGYAPSLHGISVQTFFRQCALFCGPSLVVTKDTSGRIFGGFASHQWQSKARYFGDTDCFTFRNDSRTEDDVQVEVFDPTAANTYFLFAGNTGFGMGGDSASWSIDAKFLRGTSSYSECFSSPPFTPDKDFVVAHLEVWFFAQSTPQ